MNSFNLILSILFCYILCDTHARPSAESTTSVNLASATKLEAHSDEKFEFIKGEILKEKKEFVPTTTGLTTSVNLESLKNSDRQKYKAEEEGREMIFAETPCPPGESFVLGECRAEE